MDRRFRYFASLTAMAAALVLAGCAGPPWMTCSGAQRSAAVADLLFGRNIGGKLGVSDAAWRRFLGAEVTPRFPSGFTVVDAKGQWRDTGSGRIVREPAKIVTIILDDRAGQEAAIDAVVAAYKTRFHQQAVAVAIRPACVAFE